MVVLLCTLLMVVAWCWSYGLAWLVIMMGDVGDAAGGGALLWLPRPAEHHPGGGGGHVGEGGTLHWFLLLAQERGASLLAQLGL